MSVAVAITVTIPNWTAAGIVALGLDFSQTIGPEVARLVQAQCVRGPVDNPGTVTVATTVT